MIAASGAKLIWIQAESDGSEAALAALVQRSLEPGSLTGVLMAWDGESLSLVPMLTHTIMGPDTPDWTLTLPLPILAKLGLTGEPDGSLGVRRKA